MMERIEMDRLIATQIMGWERHGEGNVRRADYWHDGRKPINGTPRFGEDPAAAHLLMEQLIYLGNVVIVRGCAGLDGSVRPKYAVYVNNECIKGDEWPDCLSRATVAEWHRKMTEGR